MPSLDTLPADQRAVLQLVLQRGRSYDEIAKLLSIDRAAVRQRALAAFDAIGPQSAVAPEQRALITDYLLGQLPDRVSETTRERIAQNPGERAWARVIASELAPLASHPLPEIPVDGGARQRDDDPRERFRRRERAPVAVAALGAPAAAETSSAAGGSGRAGRATAGAPRGSGAPSSQRGGAIVLALAGIAVIAAIIVIIALATGGSSPKKTPAAGTTTPTNAAARTNTTGTTPNILGQVNLLPTTTSSKSAGVAEVVKSGSTVGIVLRAQNVPANTKHDAYAVWLYNSPTDAHLLGFVNPGVGSNGTLTTAGALPSNAGHYKHLVVSLETQANPHQPGRIVLQGQLTGV